MSLKEIKKEEAELNKLLQDESITAGQATRLRELRDVSDAMHRLYEK